MLCPNVKCVCVCVLALVTHTPVSPALGVHWSCMKRCHYPHTPPFRVHDSTLAVTCKRAAPKHDTMLNKHTLTNLELGISPVAKKNTPLLNMMCWYIAIARANLLRRMCAIFTISFILTSVVLIAQLYKAYIIQCIWIIASVTFYSSLTDASHRLLCKTHTYIVHSWGCRTLCLDLQMGQREFFSCGVWGGERSHVHPCHVLLQDEDCTPPGHWHSHVHGTLAVSEHK